MFVYRSVNYCTAILIIIEGQLQVFQRFSSSKLVLKTVESCFMALNHYGNGSKTWCQSTVLDSEVSNLYTCILFAYIHYYTYIIHTYVVIYTYVKIHHIFIMIHTLWYIHMLWYIHTLWYIYYDTYIPCDAYIMIHTCIVIYDTHIMIYTYTYYDTLIFIMIDFFFPTKKNSRFNSGSEMYRFEFCSQRFRTKMHKYTFFYTKKKVSHYENESILWYIHALSLWYIHTLWCLHTYTYIMMHTYIYYDI
jgi:hypothetical protein